VSPTTAYLALIALAAAAIEYVKPSDSGNLRQHLRAHLSNVATFLTKTDPGGVFRALAGQGPSGEFLETAGELLW
jgi:hypothetical protein